MGECKKKTKLCVSERKCLFAEIKLHNALSQNLGRSKYQI